MMISRPTPAQFLAMLNTWADYEANNRGDVKDNSEETYTE
jgi:hypothetical protein